MKDECYEIELRINSCPHYLCVVRLAVTKAMEQLNIDEKTCGHIMLAVDEAATNIIRHGYDGREDQPIWVKVGLTTPRPGLLVIIEDLAKHVEPEQIQGRDLDDIRPGGLGVHIIKEIMDEVNYIQKPTGGMKLSMIKYLESTNSHAVPSDRNTAQS